MNFESNIKPLTDREFQKISQILRQYCGIHLKDSQKSLVSSRLIRRLIHLNLTGYSEYLGLLENQKGVLPEFERMINLLSTHTTSFFREAVHFDFLKEKALPEIVKLPSVQGAGRINIWSAACSSGEETYTLGIILMEFTEQNPLLKFKLIGSDVAKETLLKAQKAVYAKDSVSNVPPQYLFKYFLKGVRNKKGFYKPVPELRGKVDFMKINLAVDFIRNMDAQEIIFCRNVLIYFDNKTKRGIIEKFYNHLVPGGYLFVGHSESLMGLSDKFDQIKPAVYRKPGQGN